jgi:hypothetical protein
VKGGIVTFSPSAGTLPFGHDSGLDHKQNVAIHLNCNKREGYIFLFMVKFLGG